MKIGESDHRRLSDELRKALDQDYSRLLENARKEWERNLAGKHSSDACVSVCVSSGDSQEPSLPRAGNSSETGQIASE
jgi:hypothetical protein